MYETNAITAPYPPRSRELPWSKSWRKVYAEEAEYMGYRCKWASGSLLILSAKGDVIEHATPKTSAFRMSDLIHDANLKREAEDFRKGKLAARAENARIERFSRMAAGEYQEPILEKAKRRRDRDRRHSLALIASFAGMAFGSTFRPQ